MQFEKIISPPLEGVETGLGKQIQALDRVLERATTAHARINGGRIEIWLPPQRGLGGEIEELVDESGGAWLTVEGAAGPQHGGHFILTSRAWMN